ncbi:MAG: class I SAM-dependent methyltransferase [Planctomycetota bacterium]|nr:class I SAM-dependent methyltransferase [Planctomycetota bacterium]
MTLSPKFADFKHRWRVWWLSRKVNAQQRENLRIQLERSLSKRWNVPGPRIAGLVDRLAVYVGSPQDTSVLCVGVRNPIELDEFRRRGFARVTGIDLFSLRSDILVMDMHDLKFADDSFDVVFASHSLEHSPTPNLAAKEFVRVAKNGARIVVEVPVHYQTRGADLIDFGNVHGLVEAFQPFVHEVLWAEECPALSPRNEQGTDIARAILAIRKPRAG